MDEEVSEPPVVEQRLEEVSPPVEVPVEPVVGVEGAEPPQAVGEQQREEEEGQQQPQQPPPQGEEMDGQQAAAAKPDDPKIEEAKKYLEEVRWPWPWLKGMQRVGPGWLQHLFSPTYTHARH